MRRKMTMSLLGLATALTAPHAYAAPNLILNGSFEDGFDHWTQALNIAGMFIDDTDHSQGSRSAGLTTFSIYVQYGLLYQDFASIPGHQYSVTFDLTDRNNPSFHTKNFYAEFNNGQEIYIHDPSEPDGTFSQFGYTDVATGTGTTVAFRFLNPGAYILDNVQVHDVTPGLPLGTPEPHAWALMTVGFGVIGQRLRGRTRTKPGTIKG